MSKTQKALDVWITKTFTLAEKILISRALRVSKIVYLFFIMIVPNSILKKIHQIKKTFLWYSSKPKINHETLCTSFEDRDLKNVDVKNQKYSIYNVLGLKNYMKVTIMTGKVYHYIL